MTINLSENGKARDSDSVDIDILFKSSTQGEEQGLCE